MGQGKAGWLIAGLCGALVLTSIGYGLGRRAALKSMGTSVAVAPAGAPLPAIQIEPIQPQEELAAINTSAGTATASAQPAASSGAPTAVQTMTAQTQPTAPASQPTDEAGRIREVQMALRTAGFDPGSSDGKLGPRTRAAIREFQVANGLEADGKVGPRTWNKLESVLQNQKKSTSGTSTD